ncbi:MAG: hypothetical protein JKY56_15445 [Kofleriaceae bacterium]|nr:hypothetical protein [Kofleriaceae bacterium]
MNKIVLFCLAFTLSMSSSLWAQQRTVRDVPKGPVSGLEMAIEGNTKVAPGGKFRWFVTIYEIINGRKLRPSPGTKLDVQVSFDPSKARVSTVTDSYGRAELSFDIPVSLETSFTVIVEARSTKGVKRNFDVYVEVGERYKIELFSGKREMLPNAQFRVWGRVLTAVSNTPVTGHKVALWLRQNGQGVQVGPDLRTDSNGVFHTLLRAPKGSGQFTVQAHANDASVKEILLSLETEKVEPLYVYVRPLQDAIKPGDSVEVDVVVRTATGKPVRGATLSGLSIPIPTTAEQEERGKKRVEAVITDARGRARVSWKPRSRDQYSVVRGSIQALREGIGVGHGKVSLRLSTKQVLLSWSVEGGALTPGLPGRVYVRAVRPDGSPWVGKSMTISGRSIASLSSSTDADGIAVFDTRLLASRMQRASACSGATVVALRVELGAFGQELCLPVDPDSTLRIRGDSRLRSGAVAHFSIHKVSDLPDTPISFTVLARDSKDSPWYPLAQTVVTATAKSVNLRIPKEARGVLWVRARPIIGSVGREVRGGTTSVWAEPSTAPKFSLSPDTGEKVQLKSLPGAFASSTAFAMALPLRRGNLLLQELRAQQSNHPSSASTSAHWGAFLASQTPVDKAVSAVHRDKQLVSMPMPSNSVSLGLLRDPWRTQDRFVRGRLGRLFLAVENRLRESIPHDIGELGVSVAGRWRFNSELLIQVAEDIGAEAVVGLDGSPLSIAALRRLAPEFRFNNVARRVTRERLLKVLVMLRHFVKDKGLDYGFALRGDPKTWIKALSQWDDPEGEFEMQSDELYDGWGRPMAIRKAPGGRARFRFLEPIVGYEVVSAGPDGKFGNRDDLFNPFGRVLREGGVYSDAVSEAALLARLRGVELGRAIITALGELFEVEQPDWEDTETRSAAGSWKTVALVGKSTDVLKPQSVGPMVASYSEFVSGREGPVSIDLGLTKNPKSYMVVAGRYSKDGTAVFDSEQIHAGVPIAIEVKFPPRLRPQEALEIPVYVHGLGKKMAVRMVARGQGAVRAIVIGKGTGTVGAGTMQRFIVRIDAPRAGMGSAHLRVETEGGILIRELSQDFRVTRAGSLRAQHDGALVSKRQTLAFEVPSDATPLRSFLVVSGPRDILKDPGMSSTHKKAPDLLGWAYALRGLAMPKSLQPRVTGQGKNSPMPELSRACAAVAWSAMPETTQNRLDRSSAIRGLQVVSLPTSVRERSALLVALAATAVSITEEGEYDSGRTLMAKLQAEGWYAARMEKNRPTVLARLAAGLLLADVSDLSGRGLFELARSSLVPGTRGGMRLPGENGQASDGWIGSLALAIAARQLGENTLADELAVEIGPRLYLGMQGEVEPAFWLLAASVYGVFGVGSPDNVVVTIDGVKQRKSFHHGVARFAVPGRGSKLVVESSQPVIARLESRYLRDLPPRSDSPIRSEIVGDLGESQGLAALEIVVENTSGKGLDRPVVEVLLPSAGVLSDEARRSMVNVIGVVRVRAPDEMGRIRIELSPLAAKRKLHIPLAIEWVGEGKVTGLSTQSYSANSPWTISSTRGRSFQLKPAKEETWR